MINEKNREYGCKIFCIYFKNNEEKYDFGKWRGKAEINLQEIAKEGDTGKFYLSNTLDELLKVFYFINEAIQTNYKLKLNK